MVKKTRPFWVAIHKWIALTLGLWIALNGLTGSILVFQQDIEAALDPDLYRTGTPYEVADFTLMETAVLENYPDRVIHRIERYNKFPDEAYRFTTSPAGEPVSMSTDLEVFVDPVTGEILGDRPWRTVMQVTRQFHIELLAGNIGKKITGFMALFLVATVIVGVVLWWPKNGKYKRALQFRKTSPTPRLIRDLHNVFGMYFLIGFVLVSMTGLVMIFPRQADVVVGLFLDTPGNPSLFSISEPTEDKPGLQAIYEEMDRHFPGHVPTEIYYPRSKRSAWGYFFEPAGLSYTIYTGAAFVDQYSGKMVDVFDPQTQGAGRSLVGLWARYSHSGQMFGMTGRLIVFGAGIAFAALFGTGLYIWLRKRRSTYTRPSRKARQPVVDGVLAE